MKIRTIPAVLGLLVASTAFACLAQTRAVARQEPVASPGQAPPELAIQTGHASGTRQLALSSDGKLLATVGYDNTLRIWEAESRIELRTITSGSKIVHGVAFSPTKPWIVVASNALTIRDVRSGQIVRTLDDLGEILHFSSVAFSADGRYLAAGEGLGDIKLWDLQSSAAPVKLEGHRGSVNTLAFSPDGRRIVSGGRDKTVRLWDPHAGQIRTLMNAAREVNLVLFSPNGLQLISACGLESTATLWDTTNWKQTGTLPSDVRTGNNIAYRPDGKLLATVDSKRLVLLETSAWTEVSATKPLEDFRLGGLAFSPSGRWLAAGSWWERVISYWEPASGEMKMIQQIASHTSKLRTIAVTSDGKRLATTGLDNAIRLWNLATGQQMMRLPKQEQDDWYGLAFSSNGKLLAAGGDEKVGIWDLGTAERRSLDTGTGVIKAVAFSPDGRLLATGSSDSLRLWNAISGEAVRSLAHDNAGHGGSGATVLSFSHDGQWLLSANSDETISLWEVSTGEESEVFALREPGEKSPTLQDESSASLLSFILSHRVVTSVAFSPDDRTIYTSATNRGVIAWDRASGRALMTYKLKTWSGTPYSDLSSDGKILAASNGDGSINVWHLEDSGEPETLPAQSDAVSELKFHPNSRFLLTYGSDGSVRVRNLVDGRKDLRLVALDEQDWAVVDSAGRYDASNGGETSHLYWVLGLEAIGLDQLKDRYYTPHLLARELGFDAEPLRDLAPFKQVALYPAVQVQPPTVHDPVLRIKLHDRGGGIGRVVVRVNAKEMTADARGKPTAQAKGDLTLDLPIAGYRPWLKPGEDNRIEVQAYNADGYLRSRGDIVYFKAEALAPAAPLTLWAIVAGVSRYASDQINLRYASKDAADIAAAVQLGARELFGSDKVHLALFASDLAESAQPTKANLQGAFQKLAQAKVGDIVFVYLSGHGVAFNDEYYFPTAEATSLAVSDPAVQAHRAVSSTELAQWLKASPALKQVVVLDTCAAGAAVRSLAASRSVAADQIRALERLKDRAGVYVLMGAAADQVSYEASQYEQGLLTYALLKGMSGDKLREGQYVDVAPLLGYAADEVPSLAQGIGGIQRPFLASPGGKAESFDIGRLGVELRKQIPLHSRKPLLLAPRLVDEQSAEDDLRLEPRLKALLREASYRQTQDAPSAAVVFVEADEMAGAIRPSGLYRVDGPNLKVKLVLRRDDTKQALEVECPSTALDACLEKMEQAIVRGASALQ
jgi:WD40 repeat protein